MRILLLTQWFDPEPTFKGLAFARELARRGHQVQVLTGFPNYPGGKLYKGYRIRLLQHERVDGIDIVRVPLYPSHSRSRVGRIANYVSFAVAGALIGAATVTRPDVIYAYHPPATIALPALTLRLLHRARLVFDVQDLWPDSIAATGMLSSRVVLRAVSAWCRFVYANTDHIAVLSPGFKRGLIERGVPAEKISVIYNWCDESRLSAPHMTPQTRQPEAWIGKFLVIFAGTMGAAQSLDSVLDAAGLLQSSRPAVHFVFVGGGIDADRLARKATELQLTNVSFLPRFDVADIGAVLSRADALLVHLKNEPLFNVTIPSKTQAYMAAGRPILMAVPGDAANVIREANCGIACEPENPRSLADAIERLEAMSADERRVLGENGRRFYESAFSFNTGINRFEAIFGSS